MPRQRKDKQNLAEANEFWCFVARFALFPDLAAFSAFTAPWQFRTASYEFMSYKNICPNGLPPFPFPPNLYFPCVVRTNKSKVLHFLITFCYCFYDFCFSYFAFILHFYITSSGVWVSFHFLRILIRRQMHNKVDICFHRCGSPYVDRFPQDAESWVGCKKWAVKTL